MFQGLKVIGPILTVIYMENFEGQISKKKSPVIVQKSQQYLVEFWAVLGTDRVLLSRLYTV